MDPNEVLEALRKINERFETETMSDIQMAGTLGAMMAHFEALDNWLSNGGFLPKDWNRD